MTCPRMGTPGPPVGPLRRPQNFQERTPKTMEIRPLITFLRVSDLQSFTHAAAQLGYSQAAVTIQMRQLEDELGVQLFERIGRRVRLTEAGTAFIPKAREVLYAVRAAKEFGKTGEEPEGKLRVGISESLLGSVLPPVIMDFCRCYPKVELSTCTGMTAELFDMVRQNDIDILYFIDRKTDFPEWIKVAERREPTVFVAAAGHPLAGERNISLERLLKEPFLLTEKGVSYRYVMEQELAAAGLEIRPFLETGNTAVIARMVMNQMGISFLPEFAVREPLAAGRLVVLDTACPEIRMWSQLVYHRNKLVTPQMEKFIEMMKNMIFV